MKASRIYFTLEDDLFNELEAKAQGRGVKTNLLAREMVLACLKNGVDEIALADNLEDIRAHLSGDLDESLLNEIASTVRSIENRLEETAERTKNQPSNEDLKIRIENCILWAIRSGVIADSILGVIIEGLDDYRNQNHKNETMAKRIFQNAIARIANAA